MNSFLNLAPTIGIISLLQILALFPARVEAECSFVGIAKFPRGFECKVSLGRFTFQPDGNLVVYDEFDSAKWSSGTEGIGEILLLQEDGNFVIYDQTGVARWNSNTRGNGGRLVFQDDRNFVIYNQDNRPAWATNSNCSCPAAGVGAGSGIRSPKPGLPDTEKVPLVNLTMPILKLDN